MDLRAGILAVVVLVVGVGAIAWVQEERAARWRKLTVEESLGSVFVNPGNDEGGTVSVIFSLVDPAVKPQLYALLEDEGTGQYRVNVVRILGYIGGPGDAKRIEKFVKGLEGDLRASRRQSDFTESLWALGEMAWRGDQDAQDILRRMTKPEYWREAKFLISPPRSGVAATAEQELDWKMIYIFNGCRQAELPDLRELADDYLRGIPEGPRMAEMWRLGPEFFKEGHEDRRRDALREEMRAVLPTLFNGDVARPKKGEGR